MTIADGFYNATATANGEWSKTEKGMRLDVPVEVNGEKLIAIALLGEDDEKNAKTRAALASWGWDAARSWPAPGTKMRVSVKTKEYQGQPQTSVFIVKNGGGGEKVEGDDLAKFLANEKRKLTGAADPNDPFA